jgi:SAM-dependent methyltransferase
MDDPGLDPRAHRRALAELARINRLSGSARILWPPIRELAREYLARPLRVLDVACGSGDVALALARRARREGFSSLTFDGCDISPVAVEAAVESARESPNAGRFFLHDAIREPLPPYDAVICSLFLHHLSGDEAVVLLRRMKEAAARLVLINDLERSRFNYAAVWFVSRFGSPVVRFDGPASVRSAFTPREALSLAEQAGLTEATVSRRFPCRYLLAWRRP